MGIWRAVATFSGRARLITFLMLGAFLAGCNLFSPLATDKTRDLDYSGLIEKGSQAINDGDYAEAVEIFALAKRKFPKGSEAHLFHAKSIMALYGLDYGKLKGGFDEKRKSGASGLPFVDSTDQVENVDSVFYPVFEAVRDLEHILRPAKDSLRLSPIISLAPDGDTASDGRVTASVANLDLGLLQTTKTMLAVLDRDGNGRINRTCGAELCPGYAQNCVESPAFLRICPQGALSEVDRLKSFQSLTKNVKLEKLDSKDMNARDVSTNPNDINAFLDAMEGPLAGASYNLDTVSGSLSKHKETNLQGELDNVMGNVKDMTRFIRYMRFNDSIDNDADGPVEQIAKRGRMIWHDFDKDGAIRWDYGDSAEIKVWGPESGNLGYPLHRYLHRNLYMTVVEWKAAHPEHAFDTSANSRLALMIKHCKEIVNDKMPLTAKVTAAVKDTLLTICETVTTVIKPGVTPPVNRSDWVSGTYGIDEEAIDEKDNDYDGLRDEDARNAKGLDDDNDAALTVDMLGTTPAPMVWSDAATHRNGCPDIDVGQPMQAKPREREFCIGALEHRLHLARAGGQDSLKVFYSPVLTEGPDSRCLEDLEKFSVAFMAATQVTVAEKRLACRYKHIWIAPRPPNSEWTGGILGIDEEKADLLDNDGDGWIDEDLP